VETNPTHDTALGLGVPDRALQRALEFAVGIAAAGAKLRPALAYPPELKRFLRFHKLPHASLREVRAAVESAPDYRARLASVATDELVDEVGLLWLRAEPGWEEAAHKALATADTPQDEADLRREQRRREAAETIAAKTRLELVAAAAETERERQLRRSADAAAAKASATQESLAARLGEAEAGALRWQKRAQQLEAELAAARVDIVAALERAADAEAARNAALAARSAAAVAAGLPVVDPALMDLARAAVRQANDVAEVVAKLAAQLSSAEVVARAGGSDVPRRAERAGRSDRRTRARRVPLALPGGLYGDSGAVAEHLLRASGIEVLVDGYNVAKLGWPALTLAQQRDALIDAAEALAKRWGVGMHLVFDGADVGVAAPRRLVRITFSDAGVIADDVIRHEVAQLAHDVPVVVITNDQAVLADVRAMGANTLSSDQFLLVARR
jgi:hypothetical protein